MSYFSNYFAASQAEQDQEHSNHLITVGFVVDTNDPMEIHRVRVCCPAWGDDPDPSSMNIDHLPWARVSTESFGFVNQGFRGTGTPIEGETSYGKTAPARVGAEAIVTYADGNKSVRIVLGFLAGPGSANTLPHGRYKVNGSSIEGPFTVDDKPLEPLYSNGKLAFTNPSYTLATPHASYEWMSRGADFSAGAHDENTKRDIQTTVDDDGAPLTTGDGTTRNYTQGSGVSRSGDKTELAGARDASHEPQTSSWVSPGQHAIAMDDRLGNTRMRFRTTTGHQILLDDTNERIYVSTNQGNNWFEMDTNGNVDVYSSMRINLYGAKDINLTAGESIRFMAKDIHMRAGNEIRATAGADIGIHSNANVRIGAGAGLYAQSGADFNIKSGGMLMMTASAAIHKKSGASIFNTAGGTIETLAGGNIINNAPTIQDNSGTSAKAANNAPDAAEQPARQANRIPQHEPWPRMMMDKTKADMTVEESKPATDASKWTSPPISYDGSTIGDFEHKSYDSPDIGKVEGGVPIVRNKLWHR